MFKNSAMACQMPFKPGLIIKHFDVCGFLMVLTAFSKKKAAASSFLNYFLDRIATA